MSKLSVSFTLGKASVPKNVNLKHNNREFIAPNVNPLYIKNNITYAHEYIEDAYEKLFGEAVEEYNKKVSRPCRKIQNYYQHICENKKVEAFYEAVVQFGDNKTASCYSEMGNKCKEMLNEYMKNFSKRNPNLHVFNAVLHMDEATPHLHIDFIPFHTKGNINGLSKGVSMKAALNEQGFTALNQKLNRLVAWEESERKEMEHILNLHGIQREDKKANYPHMSVEDYKIEQDSKTVTELVQKTLKFANDPDLNKAQEREKRLHELENENDKLRTENESHYVSFYYSNPDKQSFVQFELDKAKVPYRETENGFEAKAVFRQQIRNIEKQFVASKTSYREQLMNDIDRFILQSKSYYELIDKLKNNGYEIKFGKYIAVRPLHSKQFIRLKSLGEHYNEQALKNRFVYKQKYETDIDNKIIEGTKNNIDITVLKVMRFYMISFGQDELPCRKINKAKPFTWRNDIVLDNLTKLNNQINEGATLESMKNDLSVANETYRKLENDMQTSSHDLKYFSDLKEKADIYFFGKKSNTFSFDDARKAFIDNPSITKENCYKIDELIQTEKENIDALKSELFKAQNILKEKSDTLSLAEKVLGGTYIQSLVSDERNRRSSDIIPNGFRKA